MSRKTILILCAAGLMLFLYFKLFYKSYSRNVVPSNADEIVVLDLKRIRNTLLWEYITTPSQWRAPSLSRKQKTISWKDMLEVPDYVCLFHLKGMKQTTWCTVLKVKDDDSFNQGLNLYGFGNVNTNEYYSERYSLSFIRSGNHILLTNAKGAHNELITTAAGLFERKDFIDEDYFNLLIQSKNHLSALIKKDSLLTEDAFLTANLNGEGIEIKANLKLRGVFNEVEFIICDSSIFTLSVAPAASIISRIMTDSVKMKLSAFLNGNADSVIRKDNRQYYLDLQAITSRIDSAVSYTYDEDFTATEQKIINVVKEPAFKFFISGDNAKGIGNYLEQQGNVERDSIGKIYTSIPFVKTYMEATLPSRLEFISVNFGNAVGKNSKAVLFANLNVARIPVEFLNYLPVNIKQLFSNINKLELNVKRVAGGLGCTIDITKRFQNKPLFNF